MITDLVEMRRGRLPRGVTGWILVLAITLGAAPLFAAEPAPPADVDAFVAAPRQIVTQSVARVITVLNEPGLTSAERRVRIEKIAFDVFDFDTMGKLVLARGWKKFDAAQQAEFIREFKIYLSRNYGTRLDRYQQTDVAVAGARLEPRNDVTVFTKVVGGQFDGVEMNYRLRERDSTWGVIDVVIEGVSLVANFRSQFKEVLGNQGPEGLLRQMKKKNAAPLEDDDASGSGQAG